MENNEFAITIFYKNVFTSLDEFKAFIEEYTSLDKDNVLHEYLYKRLLNKYCNENINYPTIDSFKRNFAITYEDNFKQYETRKRIIDNMYNLTDDELQMVSKQIQNIALNNNEILDSSKDPLDTQINYISHQQTSKAVQNKLEAYVNALGAITNQLLNDYLDKFKKHFIIIYFKQKYMYYDNE